MSDPKPSLDLAPPALTPHPLALVLLNYLDRESLWPVTTAILAHVALGLAGLQLLLLRSASPLVGFVLLLTGVGTYKVLRFERQLRGGSGRVALALLLTWLLSVVLAGVGFTTGVF